MESQKTSVELLIGSLAHDERTKWILEDYTWKTILKSALLNEKNEKIDFAKIHVEDALKAASENAKITERKKVIDNTGGYIRIPTIYKKHILNSYPLENIK